MTSSVRALRYPITTTQLANGLTVQLQADPTATAVAVNIWYRVGSGDEDEGRTGFAHLFEHLMFQGSAQVASGEHLSALEAVGGQANATTSFDRTNYFETVPPEALELALWLEADRLGSLDVSQANLDTQREVVKEEKRQRYDNVPYGDLLELMMTQNFPADHPYGHTTIGSMADLDAASLSDVQHFFARWYRPDGAILSIVGPVEVQPTIEMVDRYLGAIPPGPSAVPASARPELLPAHDGIPQLTVARPVPRGQLTLAWRTPDGYDPRNLAGQVAMEILAGSESSRLHRRLVRDLEICDAVVGGDYELSRGTSLAMLRAAASEDADLDQIRDEMVAALSILAADGPTAAELDRVKASVEREWLAELATVGSRADHMGRFATLFGDVELLNDYLDRVLAIDEAAVAQAAGTVLAPQARAELHYQAEELS